MARSLLRWDRKPGDLDQQRAAADARTPGTAGNSIRLALVVAGSDPMTIGVAGSDITVTAPTTATAAQVCTALKADAAASVLVWPSTAPGNDGTGVVVSQALVALSGAV